MSNIITNDSVGVDGVEIKEICVTAPKGMTWAELGVNVLECVFLPGCVYGSGAVRRAEKVGIEVYRDNDKNSSSLSLKEVNALFGALGFIVGMASSGGGSFGPVAPVPLIAGAVIGTFALPLAYWNLAGAAVGVRYDVETLYRTVAKATLPQRAAKRVSGFIHSPIRDTLRLRK